MFRLIAGERACWATLLYSSLRSSGYICLDGREYVFAPAPGGPLDSDSMLAQDSESF